MERRILERGDKQMRYRVKHTLKQWRQLAGLTQADLAEAVHRDRTTIVKWEQGKAHPRATDIEIIEQVLHIKWSDDVVMPKA